MSSSITINSDSKCSRREFLDKSFKGAKVIALGSFTVALINACSSNSGDSNPTNPDNGNNSGTLTVDITASGNTALQTVGGIVALSGNSIDSSGLFVIRRTQTAIDVFSRECTHQGCTVSPFNGTSATCDCHGSRFGTSGQVLQGPANRSLKKYNASISGNIITITP